MGGTVVGNCEFSYRSGQIPFGFGAKGHLLYKITIIKITGGSWGPRHPPTRTSEWVRVSETPPQGHQGRQGSQGPITKAVSMGKTLRDPPSRPSEEEGHQKP